VIRLLGLLLWDTAGPSALLCALSLTGIFAVLGAMRMVWWWSGYVQTWWEHRADALVEEIEDYLCDR
jgi:hypothetical protein